VDAHQVEGVDQEAADRVRSMVRVSKAALIVEHQTAYGGARSVGVTLGHVASRVHLRKEGLDRFLDAVGAAELTDKALLGKRVPLPLRQPFTLPLGAAALRPLCGIPPVGVARQHGVRIQPRPVLILEEVVSICR